MPHSSHSPRPIRLAVLARRFWPFSGSTEFAAGDLAKTFRDAGHDVHLLTVRWEKNWPANFQYWELPVHRISRPPAGPWSSFRYLRNLTRQLNELDPDGIVVFGLGEEAWSVTKSYGGRIPIVIRVDNHQLGARTGHANLTQRQISAVNAADRLIVESRWTADRIGMHPAVDQPQIMVAQDGVYRDPRHQRSIACQGAARVAISDAHPILMIETTQPLVVCGSPLNGDQGLLNLVHAWPRVLDRYPLAKLWILGEGTKSRMIWERILAKNLVNSVILPGSFDDLQDVFQAADIYVHPLQSDETCGILGRALSAGLCSVVSSTVATRAIVEHDVNGLVVPTSDPAAIAKTLIQAIEDRDLRDRLGRAALKLSLNDYDVNLLATSVLDLFSSKKENRTRLGSLESEPIREPADQQTKSTSTP